MGQYSDGRRIVVAVRSAPVMIQISVPSFRPGTPSFRRSWLSFFSLCESAGFDSLFLTRFGSRDKCKRTSFTRAIKAAKETLPCAACPGSPARAVFACWGGSPDFGLLGRNAAERAQSSPQSYEALCPLHCSTPRYALHGPTLSRYW